MVKKKLEAVEQELALNVEHCLKQSCASSVRKKSKFLF